MTRPSKRARMMKITKSKRKMCSPCKSELQSVTRFREFLRLKCMHPDPDYTGSVEFLKRQAKEIGLTFKTVTLSENNPIVIITWKGSDESLSSIVLNCHMDVVPVYPECWTNDPFSAVKDCNGNIYARGSQDMKCVGMQYLEAIRVLMKANYAPLRTVHVTFVPDEEVGGIKGMKQFVNHPEFKCLNVGFSLDEGLANPTEEFTVFYGERARYVFEVTCKGDTGHGSRFIKNTAAQKMSVFIDLINKYRSEQEALMLSKPNGNLGDVTTINITTVHGGKQSNIVPSQFVLELDCRITPNDSTKSIVSIVESICKQSGTGVTSEITQRFDGDNVTSLENNKFWDSFSSAIVETGIKTSNEIFSGATDSRYIRSIGIPAIGFSPMNNTPILLHDHNEFLNEKVFVRGIEIYVPIIKSITSCV